MSTEPSRNRLPFEPRQKRQKSAQAKPEPEPSKKAQKTSSQKAQKKAKTKPEPAVTKAVTKTEPKKDKSVAATRESMTIPDAVSKRMARRMAVLCGIPTFLGISTFFISYLLVTNVGLKLPNVAVVLVSMGFFGLGVLGLSYGVISASWDEEVPGSVWGWQEFTTNFGRMTAAWRSARQKDKPVS